MTLPIGILGGTFDPVHNGHLQLAIMVLEKLKLAEVQFTPLNIPAHRPPPVATAEQRLKMLNIATADHMQLKVNDCEIRRGGVSYTIDTLRLLREQYSGSALCMIIGADSFRTLKQWHQWQYFLDYVHIVMTNRPGDNGVLNDEAMKDFISRYIIDSTEQLHQQRAGRIMKLGIPVLDISSTQIRTTLRRNKKMESLLSAEVLTFIQTHKLYN